MALLPILRYPDPRLHKKAKPVAEVDERIRQLARDMAETMYDAPGVGLAATQVDVHERLVVIDVSEDGNQLLTLINPEITWRSDDYKIYEEGCLSVPGIYDEVERAASIRCKALDIDGKPSSSRPTACSRSVCSTSWTIWTARCSWNTCRTSSRTASRPS